MGWNITLKANKPISETDVQSVLDEFPPELKGFFSRQGWGWSCAADVYNPEGEEMMIGGSYSASGSVANTFAHCLKTGLVALGYSIDLEPSH